jgi:hypothetical protein
LKIPPIFRPRRARVYGSLTCEITAYVGFGWLPDEEQAEILDWLCLGFCRLGIVRGSTSDALLRRVVKATARVRV